MLAFRRGSTTQRKSLNGNGKSEHGLEDETPISPRTSNVLTPHPMDFKTPSASSSTTTTTSSTPYQAQTSFPSVPEPLLSSRSSASSVSLHTCSAPGSAVASRDQSPSVPSPSLLQNDESHKPLLPPQADNDEARAKRLGAFTSNKSREALDAYPLRNNPTRRDLGTGTGRTMHDESSSETFSDKEDTVHTEHDTATHRRGRQPATQPQNINMIRCASESPSSSGGLERLAIHHQQHNHQSHIHAVNITARPQSSSHAVDEESHRRGSFGQLVSASLDSRRHRLASRSRTRAPTTTPAVAAGRPSSVSPNRIGGRFRGMRSSSPAGNYRVPSVSASTGNGRDLSLFLNTSTPSNQPLLDFSQISEYIIGKSALKHRLVTCTLGNYRILSFPCVIEDERYPRNQFIWNLAFVFDRRSDLSGFEPVVRKCGRIFRACEVSPIRASYTAEATSELL